MKLNQVLKTQNPSIAMLLSNPNMPIIADANIFIPPDRSKVNSKVPAWKFEPFRDIWLLPIIKTFPNICMHEAVYNEVLGSSRVFVDAEMAKIPPTIKMLRDTDLTEIEMAYRNTIEPKIAKYTEYNPTLDNASDRGEVKSLAYMATKSLIYFCSRDARALRLIEEAEQLETSLDDISSVRAFEIIHLLIRYGNGVQENLRSLYKYLYYITKTDKECNPSWDEFNNIMNQLYPEINRAEK
ncbi:hypothetical protein [Sporomusa acidovorans]|uniref:PIN domain-containing protein n=1 Tax=Sporomusa acidovorans (strain ATCC 49682 / DSM 3132 / Mol) TaxID=1123286 RepID=A0ABZ3J1A1_SPOA4|nr:hypothetical protein [Sporomusa acidovorans]OZC13662.1 hypothetical protein SPACI_56430 [Sporomusa acidovorans DSM 3132]SDE85845.1 hypothetical protein SAMN04488499_10249 [Sporomusa acidovorans]